MPENQNQNQWQNNKMKLFEDRMVNLNGDLRERVIYQRHLAWDLFAEASGVISEALLAVASGVLAEDFVLAGPDKNVPNPHFIYSLDTNILPDASGARYVGSPAVTWGLGAFNELYVPEINSDVIVHGNLSSDGNVDIYGETNTHGNRITGLADPVDSTDAANKEYVDSTEGPSFYFENFSALCNGTRVTFVLTYTPKSGSLLVFLNGLIQEPGGIKDYTFGGTSITFNLAPENGSILLIQYAY